MKKGLSPIAWTAIIGAVFAVATVVLIVFSALSAFEHSCEVCMNFRGASQCRSAAGGTREEAVRTATDNACAVLGARGMTLSIECSKTPPVSVTCRDDG